MTKAAELVGVLADLAAHIDDARLALVELGQDAGDAPTSQLGDLIRGLAPATAPANLSPPVVSGAPYAGALLTTTLGPWSGSPPITYAIQWYRNAVAIPDAEDPTYQTAYPADIGAVFRSRVTATNAHGSAFANSNTITTAEFTAGNTRFDSDQVTWDTDALTFDHEAL